MRSDSNMMEYSSSQVGHDAPARPSTSPASSSSSLAEQSSSQQSHQHHRQRRRSPAATSRSSSSSPPSRFRRSSLCTTLTLILLVLPSSLLLILVATPLLAPFLFVSAEDVAKVQHFFEANSGVGETGSESRPRVDAGSHTNNWAVLVCASKFWFNYRASGLFA